jgi:hypothetical protein
MEHLYATDPKQKHKDLSSPNRKNKHLIGKIGSIKPKI